MELKDRIKKIIEEQLPTWKEIFKDASDDRMVDIGIFIKQPEGGRN